MGFLAGKGEVPSNWVINAGEKAGYSKDAVHRARRNLGDRVVVTSLPVVPRTPLGAYWRSETTAMTGMTAYDCDGHTTGRCSRETVRKVQRLGRLRPKLVES